MTHARAQAFAAVINALAPILSEIPNQVLYDDAKGFELKLDGFYKDGSIKIRVLDVEPGLDVDNTCIIIEGRYSTLSEVFDIEKLLEDVIGVQIARFRYWSEVKPGDFKEIDRHWLPVLIRMGKVKKIESYQID